MCLSALLDQDYPPHLSEILVVDNASTDLTRTVAARYPVTLLSETGIRTSYAARNRGIAHSKSDVVAFTDADCIPHPSWLKELVAPFADDAVAAVVGTVDDGRASNIWQEFIREIRPFARPERRGLKTLLTLNVAMRRSVLDAVGHFDERLPTGGDVDLGWRIQQANLEIVEAPDARVIHQHRATLRGVFSQFRRYGLSESLLATLHPGTGLAPTPGQQLRRLFQQLRALCSYGMSFAARMAMSFLRGFDLRHVAWPIFLMVVESGNIAGRITGLLITRGCRRNPFPNTRLGRSA